MFGNIDRLKVMAIPDDEERHMMVAEFGDKDRHRILRYQAMKPRIGQRQCLAMKTGIG